MTMKGIAAVFGLLFMSGAPALAATIDFGTWYQFQFDGSLGEVSPCVVCNLFPEVPPAPAQPWEFVAPPGGVFITVSDAFDRLERFEVFADGVSLGLTSIPSGAGNCGSDINLCLADPDNSTGVFFVEPGTHTMAIFQADGVEGLAAFRVDVAVIPEPAGLLLVGGGLAALLMRRRFARR